MYGFSGIENPLFHVCIARVYIPSMATVEPMYHGHLVTNQRCSDDKDEFPHKPVYLGLLWDQTKCVDYAGILIFKRPH